MEGPRTHDQHVALYLAYCERVAQLPPVAWERLRARCAELNTPAFRSLVNRALLAAKPYELRLAPFSPPPTVLRAIAGASRIVNTSLAFAFEVAAEFAASNPAAPELPRTRPRSTGNATSDAFIDALLLVEATLAPFRRTDPGVLAAVRAAGQAVLHHDFLAAADFEAAYQYIEPEIPFADLEPPAHSTNA